MKTSDKVSSIAGRFVNITPAILMALTAKQSTAEALAADIRSLAASALAQDQHKGLRGLIKRITG